MLKIPVLVRRSQTGPCVYKDHPSSLPGNSRPLKDLVGGITERLMGLEE